MRKTAYLTEKRLGKLTVLRSDKQRESGKTSWLCQCDCGNQCVVTSYSLHYKKQKSCGCLHREPEAGQAKDITDQVFGRLTAIVPATLKDKLLQPGTFWWDFLKKCGFA